MTFKSEERTVIGAEIKVYLMKHEFFWLSDLKSHLNIIQPKNGLYESGDRYTLFFRELSTLRKKGVIQCSEKKNQDSQYFSTIFCL